MHCYPQADDTKGPFVSQQPQLEHYDNCQFTIPLSNSLASLKMERTASGEQLPIQQPPWPFNEHPLPMDAFLRLYKADQSVPPCVAGLSLTAFLPACHLTRRLSFRSRGSCWYVRSRYTSSQPGSRGHIEGFLFHLGRTIGGLNQVQSESFSGL